MIFLLCLVFIGQSVASSVMVYSMSTMSNMNGAMHNMDEMDHSAMQMSSLDSSDNNDCCATECQCFSMGCSTVTVLANMNDLLLGAVVPSKIFSKTQLLPNQGLTSLFRPPILS